MMLLRYCAGVKNGLPLALLPLSTANEFAPALGTSTELVHNLTAESKKHWALLERLRRLSAAATESPI
jgi:diacylglycerol kinase family enzyme